MKKYINDKYIEMTEEELSKIEHNQKKFESQEDHRPYSQQEAYDVIVKAQINSLELTDETALKMKDYYPSFDKVIGQKVKQGFKFTYGDKLYKVIQPSLEIQSYYSPGTGTESLYDIINEQYDGDIYDPIPYDGNISLENGKYYTQGGVIYLCNRDTEQAVYNPLNELVGLYVDIVK